jgi:hypothetical protein
VIHSHFLGPEESAAVVGPKPKARKGLYYRLGKLFFADFLKEELGKVHHAHAAPVILLIVHEGVDPPEVLRVLHEKGGAGEGVIAHGAKGKKPFFPKLLGADEVPHRPYMAHEVILGLGINGAAAIPARKFPHLVAELGQRRKRRLLVLLRLVLQGTPGKVSDG